MAQLTVGVIVFASTTPFHHPCSSDVYDDPFFVITVFDLENWNLAVKPRVVPHEENEMLEGRMTTVMGWVGKLEDAWE